MVQHHNECVRAPTCMTNLIAPAFSSRRVFRVLQQTTRKQPTTTHLYHARYFVHRTKDRLAPHDTIGRLPGAPAACHLTNVVPWSHPRLAVPQAAQFPQSLEGCSLEALARIPVAVLVVHVQHPRLCVALTEAPSRLSPVRERRVLVAERVLACHGGACADAAAARATAVAAPAATAP